MGLESSDSGLLLGGILVVSALAAFLAGFRLARGRALAESKASTGEETQALLEDRNRLRLAQQIARIGSWDLDLARNRLVWSDEIFRIFEIDPTGFEASYEAFLNAVHPEDRGAVNEAYQASVRDRVPYSIAHRLLMPDGRIKHVQEAGQTYYDSWGKPLRSLGTVQDITERKLIENAQRRAHELLRGVLNATRDIIFVKDVSLNYLACNHTFTELIGRPEEQIVGRRDADWLKDPAALNALQDLDRRVLVEGREQYIEEWVTYPDGRRAPFETLKTPFRDAEGKLLGLIGVSRDITARKQAEAARLESQHRLQAAVNVSQIGIFDHDHAADALYWSPQQREIAGWGPEEPVNLKAFLSLVHPEDLAFIEPAVRRAHDPSGDGIFDVEHRIVRRDGAVRWLKDRSRTFFEGEGPARHPARTIGAVIDITRLKEIEEEQQKLIKEMESRNAELERFTYTVSHDLKSPLITIKGFLGYIEKSAVEGNIEAVRADVKRITAAADKMERLLRELLDLSRIGRVANPPEPTPFEEIAREAIELTAGRLGARGVELRIAPDLPKVYGDRARLVEAVQNILDNAAKFMGDQPRPLIEIGSRGPNPRGLPVFFIRDNGIGLDAAYHEKVFGLFDKLDKRSEGTGIGLAVVKRVVETHGGSIWIESPGEGKGSSICFALPPPPEDAEGKAPPVL